MGSQDAPFPIVPDPERVVYEAYGIEASLWAFMKGMVRMGDYKEAKKLGFKTGDPDGLKTLVPADFFIGPDSVIERAYYGSDIGDHLPLKDVMDWLDKA